MKTITFTIICFSILASLLVIGCASLGGEGSSGTNWALAENGGKVAVFLDNPIHPASSLNNGITSSENWDQKEGWQASMGGGGFGRGSFGGGGFGGGRGGGQRGGDQDRNWVMIELARPIMVSSLKIYTIDSKRYPAKDFGVRHLLVQYQSETTLKDPVWVTVNRYGKGVGARDNIVRNNEKGIINVRFEPVKTKKVRVIIYGTNDMDTNTRGRRNQRGGGGFGGGGAAAGGTGETNPGTIRLTEIEVFGT